MRIKLTIILLAIVFYNNAMVFAYDAAVDGIYYNLVPKGLVAEVTAGDEAYIGHIKIPSEVSINGELYSVTSIGEHAFFGCSNLLSVSIPNSITSIGWQAFGNCSMLESVQIPSNVTTIEGYTFRNCTNLRSVYLPNSLTKIDNSAFRKCSNLKDIIFPNSLIEIEEFAFCECESLESITIGNQLATIGGDAFNGCNGLKEVHIPNLQLWLNISFKYSSANPLFYAHKLFIDNEEITELDIPQNIAEIKSYTFAGGDFISVSIPESVRSIGVGAFANCLELKSIVIPDGVISIDYSSFAGCQNLETITLTKSVRSIGAEAFQGCI